MRDTLGSLKRSHASKRMDHDELKKVIFHGVPIYLLGGDKLKRNENVYDLTPEIHNSPYSTGYTGKEKGKR